MLPDASKTFRRRTAVRGRPMSPTQSALRHEPGEPPRRPMAFATRLFPGPEERCHDSCPKRGGRTSWRVMEYHLTTACSGRRCAPPLMLSVKRSDVVDAAELKALIRQAFAEVEYPGDWCLRGSNDGDEPYLLE